MDALFGSYAANKYSLTTYAITTGKLGGVARIDTDFFSYEFRSKKLSHITRNVVVATVIVSSADLTGLKKNDVNVIVESVYQGNTNKERLAMIKQIWNAAQAKDDDDDDDDTDDTDDDAEEGDKKSGVQSNQLEVEAAVKAVPVIPKNRLSALEPAVFKNLSGGVHRSAHLLS